MDCYYRFVEQHRCTYVNNSLKKYNNILSRDFTATKSNQKWATDISYIKIKQGMLYLSMIKNLHDNFIVAYDMRTVHVQTVDIYNNFFVQKTKAYIIKIIKKVS